MVKKAMKYGRSAVAIRRNSTFHHDSGGHA
jgi:hypothetical protein